MLAAHYDAVTGDSSTETAFIDDVISRTYDRVVTLLEVACGTGNIIAPLAAVHHVHGLDISSRMLAIARGKLPEGTALYLADMSNFALDVKFDVVICVYHGINHLLDFAAWESFFDCAYRHLKEGGILVFDVLTVRNLEVMAGLDRTVQQDGKISVAITVRPSNGAVFDWNVEVFERGQNDTRSVVTQVIRTASFPAGKIQQALSERFLSVSMIHSDGSLVDDESDSRVWFVCTKD